MSWLYALILGLLQGCTEFFPISSSAHLKLLKTWLQISSGEETVLFDLSCHLGTLFVLVIYFRKELWDMCWIHPKKMVPYSIALTPLIPAYFLLKPIRLWASQPTFLGPCLMITALLLFLTQRISRNTSQAIGWKDALWIGAFQSMALIPGISRSASTITMGLLRGVPAKEAVRFSFVLSIPAVAGGALLETVKAIHTTSFNLLPCAIGLGASLLTGFALIRIAIPLLEKKVFKPFAWYCLIISILLILL